VGSGGRALWDAFSRAPEFGSEPEPLDAFTGRVVEAATAALERAGHPSRALLAFERHGGVHADFVALAERAGLGARSRLGLLVHSLYGPWLSLRALVLTEARWSPESPAASPGFDPCRECPAPCADACPGLAVKPGGFDVARCGQHRAVDPGCAESCAARRACVLGPDHAYAPEALAHHMRHVRVP
jgi:epoxyqueuosine reductase QueG